MAEARILTVFKFTLEDASEARNYWSPNTNRGQYGYNIRHVNGDGTVEMRCRRYNTTRNAVSCKGSCHAGPQQLPDGSYRNYTQRIPHTCGARTEHMQQFQVEERIEERCRSLTTRATREIFEMETRK